MNEASIREEENKRVSYTIYEAKVSPRTEKFVKDQQKVIYSASGKWGMAQEIAERLANERKAPVYLEAWNIAFLFSGKKVQKANTQGFLVIPNVWKRHETKHGVIYTLPDGTLAIPAQRREAATA